MKLSELIAHVGDDAVKVQNLQGDFVGSNNGPKGATITFATDPVHVSQLAKAAMLGTKPDHVGLVLWLPRNRLPEGMQ